MAIYQVALSIIGRVPIFSGVDIVADNPVETMDTEFLGLHNIAKGAIVNGAEKIIYASTSGV